MFHRTNYVSCTHNYDCVLQAWVLWDCQVYNVIYNDCWAGLDPFGGAVLFIRLCSSTYSRVLPVDQMITQCRELGTSRSTWASNSPRASQSISSRNQLMSAYAILTWWTTALTGSLRTRPAACTVCLTQQRRRTTTSSRHLPSARISTSMAIIWLSASERTGPGCLNSFRGRDNDRVGRHELVRILMGSFWEGNFKWASLRSSACLEYNSILPPPFHSRIVPR